MATAELSYPAPARRPLRIAVVGSFGYWDIGDEAMLTEDLSYLRRELSIPPENILLFGEDVHYIASYHAHPENYCFSSRCLEQNWLALGFRARVWNGLRSAYRRLRKRPPPVSGFDRALHVQLLSCDAVLVTGGGTVNTRDRLGYSIRRMHRIVSYLYSLGLPIFMSGQTIGPLGRNAAHDRLARAIIRKVDVLTVRDKNYSRHYMEMSRCRPRYLLETYDDAYSLEYRHASLPEQTRAFVQQGSTIAVNTTEYTGNDKIQQLFVANLCSRLVEEDRQHVVLVSHTPKDFVNHQAIFELIPDTHKGFVHLPDTREWSASQLKLLISNCRVAIGGRYHFIVFAGTSDTPFVGMCGNEYSYVKQDGFARPLGLSRFILPEECTWNAETLWATYQRAKKLKLSLSSRFNRPTESMTLFGDWIAQNVSCSHSSAKGAVSASSCLPSSRLAAEGRRRADR